MKISTMTKQQALEAMGSEASERDAVAMIGILQASKYEDTRNIGDDEWRDMMDRAIAVAGENMSKIEIITQPDLRLAVVRDGVTLCVCDRPSRAAEIARAVNAHEIICGASGKDGVVKAKHPTRQRNPHSLRAALASAIETLRALACDTEAGETVRRLAERLAAHLSRRARE